MSNTFTPETIGVTVKFKDSITFHLRMISIDEENTLRQKMFGATEEGKAEKSYQNNVDLLADLSVSKPEGMFPKRPDTKSTDDKTTYIEDILDGKTAVQFYFKEKSIVKERLAEYAVRAYFMKLVPDISFL